MSVPWQRGLWLFPYPTPIPQNESQFLGAYQALNEQFLHYSFRRALATNLRSLEKNFPSIYFRPCRLNCRCGGPCSFGARVSIHSGASVLPSFPTGECKSGRESYKQRPYCLREARGNISTFQANMHPREDFSPPREVHAQQHNRTQCI